MAARASHVKFLESLWPCERIDPQMGKDEGSWEMSFLAVKDTVSDVWLEMG